MRKYNYNGIVRCKECGHEMWRPERAYTKRDLNEMRKRYDVTVDELARITQEIHDLAPRAQTLLMQHIMFSNRESLLNTKIKNIKCLIGGGGGRKR